MAAGDLQATTILDCAPTCARSCEVPYEFPADATFLEHKPISFPNYPYEWAPEMLHAAAILTLRLAQVVTNSGFLLKDATPYNVMFEGPKPVFLDVLSFAPLNRLDPLWRPYAQFVRTFIYPLLSSRHFGLRLDEMLLTNRDGMEPERVLRLLSIWRRWLPPFLGCVTIPALLARSNSLDAPEQYRERRARDSDEARFLLDRQFRRANRLLRATQGGTGKIAPGGYNHNYAAAELEEKERVVAQTLARFRSKSVLDIGCHTGNFSLLAARQGARVVAIDRDPGAVGRLWSTAVGQNLNILPLVIDIARPAGACGWANAESSSFLDRARGAFDCVLMLAVIHHLIVTERAPLEVIFELARALTTDVTIVEYVDPADPQFRHIARGREALHRDLTRSSFEAAARRHFAILDSRDITPSRRIYTLRKVDD